ncbi:MAG: HHL1-like protein [Elainella sp.]
MPTNLGFGKTQPKPQPSKRAVERTEAAKQYEKMKTDGLPDYEVYLRIRGKKNWFPVGVIAVKRSSQINQAIFDNQADLREAAFRLYPVLRKNQSQLEFGYRLKEFKDDDIQVAVEPQSKFQSGGIGAALNQAKDRVLGLLKR